MRIFLPTFLLPTFLLLTLTVGMFFMLGCGIGGSAKYISLPPAPFLDVTPHNVTTTRGSTVQLTATITNSKSKAVTWKVVEGAAGGTVTSSGLYTAPNTIGNYHVTAQALVNQTSTVSIAVVTAVTKYNIVELGTLSGSSPFEQTQPMAINNAGQVVGSIGSVPGGPTQSRAFLYSGGSMKDLGTLGGDISSATAINNAGQIVGYSNVPAVINSTSTMFNPNPNPNHAFLYSNGKMQDLGTLPGFAISQATGINDAGQIVGFCKDDLANTHAFLYSGGVMQDLGTLPGDQSSLATGINSAGQIIGTSSSSIEVHSFLYSNGAMQSIKAPSGYLSIGLTGINSKGQIVGILSGSANRQIFLYSNGTMQYLYSVPAFTSSLAPEIGQINTAGQITLDSLTGSDPLLYSGGVLQSLNTLLPVHSVLVPSTVTGINDSGQLIGMTISGQHGYLMTPQ